MRAWGNADPSSNISKHPASYIANFADMARDALERLDTGERLLRLIPCPDDAAHQARGALQRVFEQVHTQAGDHNEALLAAADALIAEGWTPPPAKDQQAPPREDQCNECRRPVTAWNPITGVISCGRCTEDTASGK